MWITPRTMFIAVALAAAVPVAGNAEGLIPAPYVAPVYPYKNLPGVTAPKKTVADENFRCRTTTVRLRGFHDGIFYRNLPKVGYICEQNGVISESTGKPNYQYWQYDDANR